MAEQDAERAKFMVLKAEQEKQAAIIKAEGEATAAELVSDSLMNSRASRLGAAPNYCSTKLLGY